jgi:hypothetical protein
MYIYIYSRLRLKVESISETVCGVFKQDDMQIPRE